ncbi:MAG: hypothetical protein HUU50_22580 [Candidatus Brocadiae bacterium]|nr:hypothetical protein [Candidatus Brocadiia bacterium]
MRYTIAPQAGKELLKRLLCLNHKKASEEKEAIPEKNKKPKKPQNPQQAEFF